MYPASMMYRKWLFVYFSLLLGLPLFVHAADTSDQSTDQDQIYIIPVREDIMPPLTYLVRRGVKEAIAANAECLVLDMDTNGGRVDITEEIIQIMACLPSEMTDCLQRSQNPLRDMNLFTKLKGI